MVIPLNKPARTIISHEFPGRFAHHFVQIHTNVTISTQFSLTKVLYSCKFVSFRGFHGTFHGLASPEASGSKLELKGVKTLFLFCLASLRLVDLNYPPESELPF